MKKVVLLLLIIQTLVYSQGWENTFGGEGYDVGRSVQQTTDGGYIVTGHCWTSFENGKDDLYLIKTNSYGDTLWTKTFGGDEGDHGKSVQQTTDGGYIITGLTFIVRNVDCDVYLIKTDNNGDTLWVQTYGGEGYDQGYSVQQTNDEGYIITGFTNSFGNGNYDVYLIKTDRNGDPLWTRFFGGNEDDYGRSIQQTTDGGYIIAGETYSYGNGEGDVYFIKTDSCGDIIWSKTFGGEYDDEGWSVQQTIDGGYIITGSTELTETHLNCIDDVYLIKTDNNGDSLWTKTFGGEGWDLGYSVQQTTDGGFIITGKTGSFNNSWDSDVYLIKTDSYGDTLWTKTFGGGGNDNGWSVQQTSDGGYIITGDTYSFVTNSRDVYLIKTDDEGNISSTVEHPAPNPNRKLVKTVDILGKEINKPGKNIPFIEIYDDGTTKKKMIIK